MSNWLIILAGGALTFLTRLSFILLAERRAFPRWFQRLLRYVPPAVLAAIIFPELLLPSGALDLSLNNPRLLAGLGAGLVAWRTRSALLTIATGMALLLLLELLAG